jgi:putative tricarboxylic transport membrane protein
MMRWPTGADARDAMSAAVFLVISVVGFIGALGFPDRAATWPLWMWGLLGVFSLILLAGSLRARANPYAEEETGDETSPTISRAGINAGIIIGFAVLVPILGFFVATGLYLIVHMTYLGIRPFSMILAVAIGGVAFLYVLFGFVLGVPIPHGLLY